ncbi:MAG: YtxH domain-containing protein [Brumimicrobium sp.]
MSDNKGNTGEVLLSLLAGAAIGVGVGVLIAPDKGSNTRQKIKDKFDSSKEDVMDKFDEIKAYIKQKSGDVSSGIDEAIDEALAEKGAKKEELISMLEEKLKALKKAAK